jgi:hypothetical protein
MVKKTTPKAGSWRYSDDVRTIALMAFACALPFEVLRSLFGDDDLVPHGQTSSKLA